MHKKGTLKSVDEDNNVLILYICFTIFWLVLIFALGFITDACWVSRFILIMPVIVFIINMCVGFEDEAISGAEDTQGNIITFAFVISGMLISWRNPDVNSNNIKRSRFQKKFLLSMMLSFFFLFFMHVEIAVLVNHPVIDTHFTLILISFTLTLLGYSLTEFFYTEYIKYDT